MCSVTGSRHYIYDGNLLLSTYECLNCHLHFNLRVRIVVGQFKIFKLEPVNRVTLGSRLDAKLGEGTGFPFKLNLECINMIQIDMRVSHDMDKLARFKVTHPSNHDCQQGVTGNVEGDTQSHITGSLVHLAGKLAV